MKNRVVVPAMAVFVLFIISCTDLVKNIPDESSPAAKERKEISPSKKKKGKTSLAKKHSTGINNRNSEVNNEAEDVNKNVKGVNNHADEINTYADKNGFSTKYCFLIDMSVPSGRNRFFVYDLEKNSVVLAGLVAHGSCNETFLSHPKFSNSSNCGCTSLGKYKVGELYNGKYGKSYRLFGLENSNSNAFKRGVVIHGYDCVPDDEIYPMVLCNSQGCPMVSYRFFDRLSRIIRQSEKPIVLWVYR